MRTLSEVLEDARAKKYALAHFNVSDSTQFQGIVEVAQEMKLPVVIGVSEGESQFIGIHEIAALVKAKREQGIEVFLNADHFKSLAMVKLAIEAGFDSAIIDGARLSFEENVLLTRSVVEYVQAVQSPILIEAEIGFIGESSKILNELPSSVQKVSPIEVERFVTATGVDLVAPAVGNIHGVISSGNPSLDISLIASIAATCSVPLVLHGASGCTDTELVHAVHAGVSMIHVNTEIRIAYRKGIEDALRADPKEVAPYKYLSRGKELLKNVVRSKMKLYNS